MTGAELIAALQDPAVREPVQRLLGLPSEPVAEALRELAAAQRATDASVKELAAAQKSTDAAVKDLAAEVKDLAAAQKSTDAAVKDLAAAQKSTDAAVKDLAAEVQALAAAQKSTDAAVKELAGALRATRQEMGKLSDNVGFGLEELAAIVLPDVLGRELGLAVERFEPRYITTAEGEEEVDLWGSGVGSDGRPITVLCEVKSRIYGQDVKTFRRRVDRLSAELGVRPVAVMFGFRVHPAARAVARELDVRVWASVPQAA